MLRLFAFSLFVALPALCEVPVAKYLGHDLEQLSCPWTKVMIDTNLTGLEPSVPRQFVDSVEQCCALCLELPENCTVFTFGAYSCALYPSGGTITPNVSHSTLYQRPDATPQPPSPISAPTTPTPPTTLIPPTMSPTSPPPTGSPGAPRGNTVPWVIITTFDPMSLNCSLSDSTTVSYLFLVNQCYQVFHRAEFGVMQSTMFSLSSKLSIPTWSFWSHSQHCNGPPTGSVAAPQGYTCQANPSGSGSKVNSSLVHLPKIRPSSGPGNVTLNFFANGSCLGGADQAILTQTYPIDKCHGIQNTGHQWYPWTGAGLMIRFVYYPAPLDILTYETWDEENWCLASNSTYLIEHRAVLARDNCYSIPRGETEGGVALQYVFPE